MFEKLKTKYEVKIEDLQVEVDREQEQLAKISDLNLQSADFKEEEFFAKYRKFEEYVEFYKVLNQRYPELTKLVTIGKTLNGRDIFGVVITGTSATADKKQMVFNGGQHAREWISPMTVTWIAHHLLSKYASDAKVKKLVDSLEWHLFPIINGDGYDKTWNGGRMQRKNLRVNSGSSCIGVDLNRNWDYQWNATGGSSTSPCAETFRGPTPFSEPESKAIGTYATGLKNIRGYIDFHSYSQLWMRPWGYTRAEPKDEARMKKIGDACSAAIKGVHNKSYPSGRIYVIIYPATGSSADYVYGIRNEATSFAVELRDTGSYGFLLPPDQIQPTGEENVAAVLAFGEHVLAGSDE